MTNDPKKPDDTPPGLLPDGELAKVEEESSELDDADEDPEGDEE